MLAAASVRGWGTAGSAQLRRKQVRVRVAGISLWVHRDVATLVALLVKDIVAAGYPVDGLADDWGFASRKKRPPAQGWSNHAWGLAIDLNSLVNPQRRTLRTQFAPAVVRGIAARYGFRWGGDFPKPDPMHFEFVGSPADARALTLARTHAALVVSKPTPSPKPAGALRLTKPYTRSQTALNVQRALLKLGYRVAVDGAYGPGTAQQLRNFQRSRGLTPDGVVGPATLGALRKALR